MLKRYEKNFYDKNKVPNLRDMTDKEYANFVKGLNLLNEDERVSGKHYDYWLEAANYTRKNRTPNDIQAIVIHTTEGWSPSYFTFKDPERKASAHYGVERDGTVIYMVDEKDVAWHAGTSVNNWSVGIETTGFSVEDGESYAVNTPIGFGMTQIKALAKLTANIAKRNNIPIDRNHIFGHRHVGGCGSGISSGRVEPGAPLLEGQGGGSGCHYDPGNDFPWDKFMALVKWYRYRSLYMSLYGIGGAIAIYFAYEYAVNDRNPLDAITNLYNKVI